MKKYFKYISIPIIALMFILFFSPGSASANTFGNTVAGTNANNGVGIYCNSFVAPGSGTITSISSYAGGNNTTSGFVGHAIYSDSAGAPNTLIASDNGSPAATAVSITGAYISSSVRASIVSGTTYWLCSWASSGVVFRYYTVNGQTAANTTAFTYESWPGTYGTVTTQSAHGYSIYATYTPTYIPRMTLSLRLILTGRLIIN